MKRVYKRQKSVCPVVSSQERRALFVPLINWLSAAGKTLVERGLGSSTALHRISLVRAAGKTFRTCVFDAFEDTTDGCLLGKPFCRSPVLPGPAPSTRRAPPRPRPAGGMFVFWTRQVNLARFAPSSRCCPVDSHYLFGSHFFCRSCME